MAWHAITPPQGAQGVGAFLEAHGIAVRFLDGAWVADSEGAQALLDAWDGSPVPDPVPEKITLRQFLLAATAQGWISEAEALAAARTGAVPALLTQVMGAMPPEQAFAVELTFAAMYEVERASPLWDALVLSGLASAGDVDSLFRAGAGL